LTNVEVVDLSACKVLAEQSEKKARRFPAEPQAIDFGDVVILIFCARGVALDFSMMMPGKFDERADTAHHSHVIEKSLSWPVPTFYRHMKNFREFREYTVL